ncbi:hypothetical protein ACQKQC_19020 [Vibrio fortis]|uniref:hypothetical protein n=1 Tax=Vibrio fortis TaxID=212667 RepID=UPI003379A6BA|nr:conserved hypothetical protein [Vibrio chagasii]
MAIKAANLKLAHQFIAWCFAKKLNPYCDNAMSSFDEFTKEVYGETVTERRKESISSTLEISHHDFMIEVANMSLSGVREIVSQCSPKEYGFSDAQ